MVFLEWICYVISEEMSFEVFSPIWSHAVNENEKKGGVTDVGRPRDNSMHIAQLI